MRGLQWYKALAIEATTTSLARANIITHDDTQIVVNSHSGTRNTDFTTYD